MKKSELKYLIKEVLEEHQMDSFRNSFIRDDSERSAQNVSGLADISLAANGKEIHFKFVNGGIAKIKSNSPLMLVPSTHPN